MSTQASPAQVERSEGQPHESKMERLRGYLREETADQGVLYVKSKFIADDVELSAKEIGQLLLRLQETTSDIEIEQWSYTGATTWRVAPDSA